MATSHVMTIDLKNLQSNASNYKVISFPTRVKITNVSFAVNGAAAGSAELARVWQLYAWGGHPTPTVENTWSEWTFPVFNFEQKPVLNNELANFYSTIEQPASQLIPLQSGGGILNFELNQGVFAPNDYMAIWIQNTAGDIEGIVWEDTEATINIVYEDTVMRTPYENYQANPWID